MHLSDPTLAPPYPLRLSTTAMPARRTHTSTDESDANYSPGGARPAGHSPKRMRNRKGGNPRLKSGCITCRIRRKKCDEAKPGCTACTRLRIECLGYGERRPSWLREQRALEDAKARIKKFLHQQGMVKGAANAQRLPTDDADAEVLTLTPGPGYFVIHREPSQTPSSAGSAGSAGSGSSDRHTHQPLSACSEFPPETLSAPAYVADYTGAGTRGTQDAFLGVVPAAPSHVYNPFPAVVSTSLVPPPQIVSSFGAHYNGFNEDAYTYADEHIDTSFAPGPMVPVSPMAPVGSSLGQFVPNIWEQPTLQHYFMHVVAREYLLADRGLQNLIWKSVQNSPAARQGVCLIAELHSAAHGASRPAPGALVAFVNKNAAWIVQPTGCDDAGSAFAALQIVSCYLFAGGRGPWAHYIEVATNWVEGVFAHSAQDPVSTFRAQSDWVKFLMKTTMWFDVLGAVTRRAAPRLLSIFRELFHSARIDDGAPTPSMVSIMGCENGIVLALAEISHLAHLAEEDRRMGQLSMPTLVASGLRIERDYLGPPALEALPLPVAPTGDADARAKHHRALTAAVFRAAARVYLHSVLSGDMPGCREIAGAVNDTVAALQRVPSEPATERAVVRQVVFAICVAGCLTDEPAHRAFLLTRLNSQAFAETTGNCEEVRQVMQRVWDARDAGRPVSWRHELANSADGVLLLV